MYLMNFIGSKVHAQYIGSIVVTKFWHEYFVSDLVCGNGNCPAIGNFEGGQNCCEEPYDLNYW